LCTAKKLLGDPASATKIDPGDAGLARLKPSRMSSQRKSTARKPYKKFLRRPLKLIPVFLIRFLPLAGGAGRQLLGPAD
jgi:hypothetical protein